MTSNKQFWDAVKPLFTNKNLYFDDDISINDKNKINNNEVKLFELLNTIFIDEVENTTGKALSSLGDSSNQQNDTNNVEKIITNKRVKL